MPTWEVPGGEIAPRQGVLYIGALTMVAGGILFGITATVLWLQGSGLVWDIAGAAGIVAFGGVIYFLARRGRHRAAGVLTIVLLTLVPTYFLWAEGPKFAGILFFAGGVVFGDLVIGGRIGLIMAAVNSLLYLGLGLAHQVGWLSVTSVTTFVSDFAALALMILGLTLAAGTFTRGMRQAIQRAEEQEQALQAADQEKAHLLAELQTREEAQRRLLETVRELASPIIPLAEGIIAMPVIGTVDSARAQQIRTALLRGVSRHRARVAIVDITGLAVVDTAVAQALLQTAQGIDLLGALPILVGIRGEVAQTLMEMGVDMTGIVTRGTLREGLEHGRAVLAGLNLSPGSHQPAQSAGR